MFFFVTLFLVFCSIKKKWNRKKKKKKETNPLHWGMTIDPGEVRTIELDSGKGRGHMKIVH